MTPAEHAERLRQACDSIQELRHHLDILAAQNTGIAGLLAQALEAALLPIERIVNDVSNEIDPPRIVHGQAWLRELLQQSNPTN